MLLREIKQALMGKVVSYYNGWNGHANYFKIGYIENCNTSICVYPERGKGFGVFIPKSIIPILVERREYIKKGEIERCSFEEKWNLL